VPFLYLRTGKRWRSASRNVIFQFKAVPYAGLAAIDQPATNRLVIRLQPGREHQPVVNGPRTPGRGMGVAGVGAGSEFCDAVSSAGVGMPTSGCLLDVDRGAMATLFMRRDEIEAALALGRNRSFRLEDCIARPKRYAAVVGPDAADSCWDRLATPGWMSASGVASGLWPGSVAFRVSPAAGINPAARAGRLIKVSPVPSSTAVLFSGSSTARPAPHLGPPTFHCSGLGPLAIIARIIASVVIRSVFLRVFVPAR